MANDQPLPAAPDAPARAPLDPAADPASWAPVDPPVPRCPWCSAALPAVDLANCPSCRAQLVGGVDAAVPGLTEVAPAGVKAAPLDGLRKNRLMAWISGDVDDEPAHATVTPTGEAALAPPTRDVKREILRLELAAAGIEVPAHEPTPPASDDAEPAAAAPAADTESTAA